MARLNPLDRQVGADDLASVDPRRAAGALSWSGMRRLLTERRRLAKLLPLAGWRWVLGLCGLLLIGASVPSTLALASGWLVSRVLAARDAGGLDTILPPIVALAVVLAAQQVAEAGQELVGVATARRIDGAVRAGARELTLVPTEMDHLEDAMFHDDLTRLWDTGGLINRTRSPGTAAVSMLTLNFRLLGVAAAAGVLFQFSPLLGAGLLLATMVTRAIGRRQWMFLFDVVDARARHRRRVEAWSEFAVGAATAKEVRLFGLAEWATGRREHAAVEWASPIWTVRRSILRRQGTTVTLSAGSAFAALLVPALAAASGQITAQQLVVYLVAALGVLSASYVGPEAPVIEYGMGAVRALDRLVARYTELIPSRAGAQLPASGATAGHAQAAQLPAVDQAAPAVPPHVRFDGVSFAYPGAAGPVLDRVDLTIRPGEVLAIVGRNGAGKTTLMKLLAGLYRPTSGRLLVDGRALADFPDHKLVMWRRRLAMVFQDFVRYPATLADNIALSAPEHLGDERRIREAARRAGLQELVAELPSGFATPLCRASAGSMDLSGGQWQRLAIARALFAIACDRRLLVLDEPTANLDVRAEAQFFDQVVREVSGVSVVLISHRLSTVRHADRIVLLRDGQIAESGSHAELLDREGEYARLFRLQAARFDAVSGPRDTPPACYRTDARPFPSGGPPGCGAGHAARGDQRRRGRDNWPHPAMACGFGDGRRRGD